MLEVKGDSGGALEKHREHDARLNTGNRRPDAVVDAASEGHVA
jgi:hypothetical protein